MNNELYAHEKHNGFEIFVSFESYYDESATLHKSYDTFVSCFGDYRYVGTYDCGEYALMIGKQYIDNNLVK